ncbi:MAG TPA: ParB/RepB/Spo0J family partition protein [Bacteroidetes bacterium]|nr:ParB/RepB/Spo0J family partition protein [Bacteroidota bacterium]
MAKRKINASKLLEAGKDAHLQTTSLEKISHAKSSKIDGESFLEVDVDKIENNPLQPRLHINTEELHDLIGSIKLHGLIQPISVIKTKNDTFILKAGQRRWLAHKELGLKKIKAIVEDECDVSTPEGNRKLFEIAVLENTQRDNLYPLELALALQQALDRGLYRTNQELGLALSKTSSYITKVLKVLTLSKKIIEDLKINRTTNDIEALYEIQKIKDEEKQIQIYFDFVNKKLNREDIRKINRKKIETDKEFDFFELKLDKKALKVKVNIENLTFEEKNNLSSEIENLLKKYKRI